MARRQIGTVAALWRYPVKSFRGESLREAMLTERGLAGDRAWALRELDRGGIMSARTWPSMLDLCAAYETDPNGDSGAVRIELPGGGSIVAGAPDADRTLSDIFRRRVRLERTRLERMTPEEFGAIARGDAFPPRRDFFDEDVIHLIATGTLAHMRSLNPGSDFDPRRFRANIYVDTGANAHGFIEDEWLGGAIGIAGGARIAGLRPAIRCAITTHPQWGLPHDAAILRTAWRYHQAYAGVFAAVEAPGPIHIGDAIYLAD